MAKQFPGFDDATRAFVAGQHMFFVGSAAPEGRVNISPKGGDSLRILGPNRLIWRNITGSGNETAGHLLESPRMTVMWCSFSTHPMILRAYGTARAVHRGEPDWDALNAHFPDHTGARQVFDMDVDLVQTSCGYAVPFMDFREDRPTLDKWTEDRGPEGIEAYWQEKNRRTIDGKPTGIPE